MGQITPQRRCSNCGVLNNAGDDYCSNCGFALNSPPMATVGSSFNTPTVSSLPMHRVTGALTPGSLLGSRYRMVQLLGKGGFGAVYLADDERFQGRRRVAVKEMSDSQLNPNARVQAIANFRQEANLLVALGHPNLPDVSDFLEEDGKAYLVMEFIDGQTIEKVQEDTGGPLNETLVMGWALQLCDVLDYLHTQPQPIVFRDLKPSNIMLTRLNQIKLIDFGIARIFKSSSARDTDMLGSHGYAPLEQYGRGQSDARTDIYALGATLYDLLTNNVPPLSPMRRVNPQAFIPPRQLNASLSVGTEQIILHAMGELPEQRYQSATQMLQAIKNLGFSLTRSAGGMTTASGPGDQPSSSPLPPPPPSSRQSSGYAPLPPSPAPSIPPSPAQSSSYVPPPAPSRISRRLLLIGGVAAVAIVGGGIYFISHRSSGTSTGSQGPISNTVSIKFAYSTEKEGWLRAALEAYQKTNPTLQGKAIEVQLNGLASVDSQNQILNGTLDPMPTAWSPASNLEINRLNYKWQQSHSGQSIIDASGQYQPASLVKSPLVLASWHDRAQKILSNYKVPTLDWTTLSSAFKVRNWSQIGGNATWGPVKFGQTLPVQSNSGLLTITLLAYNHFNEERDLTLAQVQAEDYWTYLGVFESAVNAFGQSSGTYLLNSVIQGGPAQADVIATYENLILANQTEAQSQQRQALQLYYPPVNILSDHPFAVLQGKWSTDEQKQAANHFRDFLLSSEQQRQALTYGFRPANTAISLTDSVSNNLFISQAAIFPDSQPDPLLSLAQAPSGNVIDALIAGWTQRYPTPPTTNG